MLQDFIQRAPDSMNRAKYSAARERSVGLGVMGLHSFFQSQNVPIESVMAKVWNKRMFKHIKLQADAASIKLAQERGACPDAADYGNSGTRFLEQDRDCSRRRSISIICGENTSPGIEPNAANSFLHKTLSGSFAVRNEYLSKVLAKYGQAGGTMRIPGAASRRLKVRCSSSISSMIAEQLRNLFSRRHSNSISAGSSISRQTARLIYARTQSLNVFLPADVHKRDLHLIHFSAWKKGVKSLYYCRSKSLQRAESSAGDKAAHQDRYRQSQPMTIKVLVEVSGRQQIRRMPGLPVGLQATRDLKIRRAS